jgi:uncharacterized protein (TIRG00374 family)
MTRPLILIAKLALSIGLVCYAFSRIGPDATARGVGSLELWAVFAGPALVFAQFVFTSERVVLLLKSASVRVSFGVSLDATMIGAFFSQTMVSFISGDVMRVWRIVERDIPLKTAASAVLLDRMFGFVALNLIILAGIPHLFSIVTGIVRPILVALVVLVFASCVVLFYVHRVPVRWQTFRAARFAAALSLAWRANLRDGKQFAAVLAFSLLIQSLNILTVYAIAGGLAVNVSLLQCFALLPPVLLLAMMPISVAGWGVREGAMVVAFGWIQIPPSQSLAVSICYGLAVLAASLPGGVLWLVSRRRVRTKTA